MSIIDKIKSQHPPGKFFEKNIKMGIWQVLDHQKAYSKTSQALRERARTYADKKSAFHKKIDGKEYRCKNNLILSSYQNSIACNPQKVDFHDFSQVSALHGKKVKTVIRRKVDDERAYMNTSQSLRELVHTHADERAYMNTTQSLRELVHTHADKKGAPQEELELSGVLNPNKIYNEEELFRKSLQDSEKIAKKQTCIRHLLQEPFRTTSFSGHYILRVELDPANKTGTLRAGINPGCALLHCSSYHHEKK
jgi:hypothetical protein